MHCPLAHTPLCLLERLEQRTDILRLLGIGFQALGENLSELRDALHGIAGALPAVVRRRHQIGCWAANVWMYASHFAYSAVSACVPFPALCKAASCCARAG